MKFGNSGVMPRMSQPRRSRVGLIQWFVRASGPSGDASIDNDIIEYWSIEIYTAPRHSVWVPAFLAADILIAITGRCIDNNTDKSEWWRRYISPLAIARTRSRRGLYRLGIGHLFPMNKTAHSAQLAQVRAYSTGAMIQLRLWDHVGSSGTMMAAVSWLCEYKKGVQAAPQSTLPNTPADTGTMKYSIVSFIIVATLHAHAVPYIPGLSVLQSHIDRACL